MSMYFIQLITIFIGIVLPIIISILKNKHYLESEPKKILYKMPLYSFIVSLGLSILVELYAIFDLYVNKPMGDAAMGAFLWPFFALGYIFGVTLFVLFVSLGMFYWNKRS